MLCTSCRRTLLQRIHNLTTSSNPTTTLLQTTTTIRTIATVPHTSNAAFSTPPSSITAPNPKPAPPAHSSSTPSANQPFSEPFFPSSTAATTTSIAPGSPRPNPSAPTRLKSSLPGGTALNGLTYVKNPPKPLVALEDDEYPSWLWTLLEPKSVAGAEGAIDGGVDVASMSKKNRGKYERKQAKLLAGMEKPIPLHEQSRDLTGPGDDARVSVERRSELTKSMREARRKGIREANFLRSM